MPTGSAPTPATGSLVAVPATPHPPSDTQPGTPASPNLRALHEMDLAVYRGVAGIDIPVADRFLRPLSEAANFSRIWLAVAAAFATAGGPAGRRSALRGVVAIAVTSALTNVVFKNIAKRPRPDAADVGDERRLDPPASHSFPSGHTASAFAFAAAASADAPFWLRDAAVLLATLVGFSRVYTGVHYPGDVLAGSAVGWVIGRLTRVVLPAEGPPLRLWRRRDRGT